ncbi:helix-turn-helix domain-containing protein [Streptomyces sp. NPDC056160]|uniref:AraC-like ligand-binding domain-containing protein n=1 Tax=Streptomyces sp. NPDC056160 TaxID=3345731 RepID=UPI0035DA3897
MPKPPHGVAPALLSVSSSALPARDRFSWYTDMTRQHVAPVSLISAHADDFRARVLAVELCVAQIGAFTFPPLRGVRTARDIRRGDPETYQLGLITGSPMRVQQRRSDSVVENGGLVLFDTSHPLDAWITDASGTGQVALLRVSKRAFPLSAGRADRLLAQPLSPHGVTGTLLRSCLTTICDRAAELGPAERRRLGSTVVDLAASFLADHLDAQHLVPPETRCQVLLTRIDAFIDHNLGDPGLTPAAIAAHHHLSVRALHRLFRQKPDTVAATIRSRRLERCRADLQDRRFDRTPVAVIAARWGLLAPAEFSRAFKAAYGVTPTEWRSQEAAPGRSAPSHK